MNASNGRSRGIVVHALHKSATMFLFKFFKQLADMQGFDYYSENNDPPNDKVDIAQPTKGFCICPFRSFETELTEFDKNLDVDLYRIFHVRDPRDMLVSEYFSFAFSHPVEHEQLNERRKVMQKMSIDEYVLNQPEFSRWPLDQKFAPLMNRTVDPNSEFVVKYETMVTQFPKWLSDVIRPFPFRSPKMTKLKLAWKYRKEFQPDRSKNAHKRRVIPGDFRNQLKPATIKVLDERFADVLDRFEYSRD